jgi:hypothetical protein
MNKQEQHAAQQNGNDMAQGAARLLQVSPISIGVKVVLAAQEVITKPVQQIAEDLGKKEQELTPYDVITFTYMNLPKAVGKAFLEASLEQVEAWQSTMLKSLQTQKFFPLSDNR